MPEIACPVSLAALLESAAATLVRSGVPEPRREVVALWSTLAGCSPGAVWIERDGPAAPALVEDFQEAVARRAAGMPAPYATGRAAFRTLELAVDRRALIPRPETEGLVELALRWAAGKPGGVVADVGTGTGCIALALAIEGRFERIIATDRSLEAAALARENVARVRPGVPVEVRVGHLLAPLPAERCRVIVANPPYLTEGEWAALDPGVREFEPKAALASGPDGLAATRALLAGARAVLEPGGLLALEIDERRHAAVRALAHDAGWSHVNIHRDLFGRPRYALAV
ncbi:MAG: peptide chain release factor N(5)-glutamine methyltransferase [Gemmatimonadales bacterium]